MLLTPLEAKERGSWEVWKSLIEGKEYYIEPSKTTLEKMGLEGRGQAPRWEHRRNQVMGMGEKGGEVTSGPEEGQKGPSIIISLEQKC